MYSIETVTLSQPLLKHHNMKTMGGVVVERQFRAFLAPDRNEGNGSGSSAPALNMIFPIYA
jgi:hypothetical protein